CDVKPPETAERTDHAESPHETNIRRWTRPANAAASILGAATPSIESKHARMAMGLAFGGRRGTRARLWMREHSTRFSDLHARQAGSGNDLGQIIRRGLLAPCAGAEACGTRPLGSSQ